MIKVDLDNSKTLLGLKSGIYGILCISTNKWYIGRSIYKKAKKGYRGRSLAIRLLESRSYLRKGKYHNDYVQRAWNKYGEEKFEFYIIERAKNNNLPDLEAYYMETFKSLTPKCGYNLLTADVTLGGWKHKKSTIEKLKEIAIIRAKEKSEKTLPKNEEKKVVDLYLNTDKSQKDIGLLFKCSSGVIARVLKKYISKFELEEIKYKKLCKSHENYIMPKKQRKKISQSNKGRIVSKNTCEKISQNGSKHKLIFNGIEENIKYWSQKTGLKYSTIYSRYKKHLSPEECLKPIKEAETIVANSLNKTIAEWSELNDISGSTIRYRKKKNLTAEECIGPKSFKKFDEILHLLQKSDLPKKGMPEYYYFMKYRMYYRQKKLLISQIKKLESIEWWSWTHGTKTLKAFEEFINKAKINKWNVIKKNKSMRDKWEMQCPMKHLVLVRPMNLIKSWQNSGKFKGCKECLKNNQKM